MTPPALLSLTLMAPSPAPVNDDAVTPGPEGFIVTALVVVLVLLLILDMVRRIRRTTYRAQIRERLEAEQRENSAAQGEVDGGAPGQPTNDTPSTDDGPPPGR